MPEKASSEAPAEDAGFVIPRLPAIAEQADPPKRVPAFYIGDTEHTMIAEPSFSISTEYLYLINARGYGVAMNWLLDEVLGWESHAALRGYKALEKEQLGQVVAEVSRRTLGAQEIPKASSDE